MESGKINDELRVFIHDITLFLQQHSNYNHKKIEPMFQRAYKLYVKYDVEKTFCNTQDKCECHPHDKVYYGCKCQS